MASKKDPLDINYSLKIGTSLYHVMGKQKGDRKGKYDYYVLSDKLVRTKPPKRRSSKSMSIADRAHQSEQADLSDNQPRQLDTTELQEALAEMMRQEREELLQNVQTIIDEKITAMQKALDSQRKEIIELMNENRRLAEENARKSSTDDVIQKIIKEITSTHKLSKKDIEQLTDALKNSITTVIQSAVDSAEINPASLENIKKTVIEALISPQVTEETAKEIKKVVAETVEKYTIPKSITIMNHIDPTVTNDDDNQNKSQTKQSEE